MAPAAPVFSLRALAMAAMLAASLSSAHAAIFEDGEARRAILEMRQRVDGLQLSQQRSAEEVRKLGEENAQLRRSLLDLQTQIETLRAEQAKLNGQNEQLLRDVGELQRRQKDIAQGVDERLRQFEPIKVTVDGREFQADAAEKRDFEAALAVFDLVDAEGFPVQIYEDGTIYVSRRNEYADIDQKLTGLRQVVVDNFRSFLAAGAQKMVIPGDPALLKPLEVLLKTFIGDRVTIFTSKPYFLEILPPATGKGEALAVVAQMLGIDRNQVMAIGDSMNDESMIRWAGYGVAMLNGDPRIKAIAKAVTSRTNEEDGVADFVEQHLLKGKAHAG